MKQHEDINMAEISHVEPTDDKSGGLSKSGRHMRIFSNAEIARGGHEDVMRAAASSAIVHVFESPSRTDFNCLKAAYQSNGLPVPARAGLQPMLGQCSSLALSRRVKSATKDIENLKRLLEWQRRNDFAVVLLPQVVFYGSKPGRTGPERWWDKWSGPEDRPKLLRKWLRILISNGSAVIQAGEAINLREFLSRPEARGLPDAAVARILLDTLRRDFYNLRRAVLGPPVKPREAMKEKVRRHPALIKAVEEESRKLSRSEWQVWAEVDRMLDSIMADYDVRFIRIWARVLSWVWRKFFEGIAVDHVGLERVRKLTSKNPVIYVPCHKSHADYLLVSYLLFVHHLTPPHIAAGGNLSFWPLGYIFRKSGAFFLRRSFKDAGIYPAVFESYVRTLMREGFDLEGFIEGGRSRTGKLFLPKMGLLSMMFRAFEDGEQPDLNFVPISINYDRVPEEEELLGETQQRRLLPPGWRGMWKVLGRNNGLIHINFAPPVSLREYLNARNAVPANMETEERRALYRDFAFKLIRSINDVSVVTPNALAAAALLGRENPKMEEGRVQEDAAWLLKFLIHSRARLAPTLRHPESAIAEALRLNRAQNFIRDLKIPGSDNEPQIIEVAPEKRPHLEMYKNNILHLLYPSAFVARSILSKGGPVSTEEIIEDYQKLMLLMKYELVYSEWRRSLASGDTFRLVSSCVHEVLGFFEREGLVSPESQAAAQLLSPTALGRELLPLFSGQIGNLLEAYRLVFEQGGPASDDKESEFAKRMVHVGLRAYHLGRIRRREAISVVTFKNALSLLRHLEKIGQTELVSPASFNKFFKPAD